MSNNQDGAMLSIEQIQLLEKLTAVLMPYASERRSKTIEGKRRFVHYTSAAGGLGIINSKSLWMRSTTAMSDYSEVQHGFQKLGNHPDLLPLLETLDKEISGLGREAQALFQQWWQNIQLRTFITSISEHKDSEDQHGRLSMWRAFGGTGARVALVLNIPMDPIGLQALRLSLSPVAYFTDDQLATELSRVRTNVINSANFLRSCDRQMVLASAFAMLMMGVICLKHEGFHEEVEWRVCYSPILTPSALIQSSVEIVEGIPQKVFKIPLGGGTHLALDRIAFPKLLDRVIIGPSPYPWVQYEAYVDALERANVPDAANKVFVSGIPLRR